MRTANLVSFTALGAIFGLLVALGFFAFYPLRTIELESPFKVITKQVIAGEDLIYQAKYCKYDTSPAKVYRTLVGTDFVPTPVVGSVVQKGCHAVSIHLNVPKNTTPGTYRVEGRTVLEVNSVQTQTKLFRTETFEVVEATPSSNKI